MHEVNSKKSLLYGMLAIGLWSTVATAFKLTLSRLDLYNMLFYSSLVSLGVLFIALCFSPVGLRALKAMPLRDFKRYALLGFLNPLLYYVVLFKAYALLPAQIALPLNYIWPLALVALATFLLKQKITRREVSALAISFVGVVIIASEGDLAFMEMASPSGIGLALGSSLIWALYWILNQRDIRPIEVKLFLNFLFGTIYVAITLPFFSTFRWPDALGLYGVLHIGLFEMGITFILWLKALKYAANTAKIASLVYLAPFFSLIFIHIFVGEKIYWTTVAGLLLIITGIIYQKLHRVKERSATPES